VYPPPDSCTNSADVDSDVTSSNDKNESKEDIKLENGFESDENDNVMM
jgi:hypothetical protein